MRLSIRKKICVMLAVCLLLPFLPAQAEETDIKALQTRLLDLGYEIGKADGVFGKKTSAAIALAQTLLAEQGFEVQSTGPEPAAKQCGRSVWYRHGNCGVGI